MPFSLALIAIFSILVSEPTTYGQWLQVNITMVPFSPIVSINVINSFPEFGFALDNEKFPAKSPGSRPIGFDITLCYAKRWFNPLAGKLHVF